MKVPKKVLLAEDDKDDQQLFYDFLHGRTDIVIMPIMENGEDVLRYLEMTPDQAHLPDLIILDQNMPKRNGLQTLQALKETQRYLQIPVIVYSTYADQHLINRASVMGATTVASKPISKEGYNEMMDAFLNLLL